MTPYIGIVHQDDSSAYGIAFPDAPGCFSASDSLDQVFVQAEEALELWLEVARENRLTIPQPRGLSTLKRDPEWSQAFDDAVIVIAIRPPLIRLQPAA